jgi:hypothetical protein
MARKSSSGPASELDGVADEIAWREKNGNEDRRAKGVLRQGLLVGDAAQAGFRYNATGWDLEIREQVEA